MTNIEQQMEALAAAVAKGFDGIQGEFEGIRGQIRELESDMKTGFRDVRADLRELREISIPLPEQEELWKRISRIEQHLGLSPELG